MTPSAGAACIIGSTTPTPGASAQILARKTPGVPEKLSAEVVAFVQLLRGEDLFKLPGVAETIDWASALTHLNQTRAGTRSSERDAGGSFEISG